MTQRTSFHSAHGVNWVRAYMSQVCSLSTGPPHLTRSQQKDRETLPLAQLPDNYCGCNVMLHVATCAWQRAGARHFPVGSPVLRSCNNNRLQRISILSAAGPLHIFAKPPLGRDEEKVKSAGVPRTQKRSSLGFDLPPTGEPAWLIVVGMITG